MPSEAHTPLDGPVARSATVGAPSGRPPRTVGSRPIAAIRLPYSITSSARQGSMAGHVPVRLGRPLLLVRGCRFSAAPDLAMLVVASRQLRQALA